MKLQKTNHSYYCSESNYYVDGYSNYGRSEYDTWNEFKEDWLVSNNTLDDDYNHMFRFDINELEDQDEQPNGKFELWLFFILQRKGIFRPVWIREIAEEDMKEIEVFLKERWNYLKKQWEEVSG